MASRKARATGMTEIGKEMVRGRRSGTSCPGPVLAGHTTRCYEDQRAWIIDETLILCSESEYHCLRVLLEQANHCVPFEHFVLCLQETALPFTGDQKHAKMRIAHLISTLRPKIWASGLEIVSVMNVGYILLAGSEESGTPS